MGYCFMTFEKVKTKGALTRKYEHNYRTGTVPNADPSLAYKNDELVKLNGKTYNEAFDEKLNKLKLTNPTIRKNAVLALEVITTFSRDDRKKVNLEKWKQDQVKWLRKTFNANEEQFGDNVISVMFHGDENGNVHCHAIIIPIDDKGHLNASYYTDGRKKCRDMQDSYGEIMERNHNLQRGLMGSCAKHQDIKKFYTMANQALAKSAPEIKKINGRKETVEEYRDRITEEVIKPYAVHEQDMKLKHQRELDEAKTFSIQDKTRFYKEKEEFLRLKGIIENLTPGKLEEIQKKSNIMDMLNEAIQNHPDRNKAEELYRLINEFIDWERKEKEKDKKKNNKQNL